MKFQAEYTDTYGGEANYSWVRRAELETEDSISDRALMRRAKKALGLTGMKGVTSHMGDSLMFRPYGCCAVLFVYHVEKFHSEEGLCPSEPSV